MHEESEAATTRVGMYTRNFIRGSVYENRRGCPEGNDRRDLLAVQMPMSDRPHGEVVSLVDAVKQSAIVTAIVPADDL